MGSHLQTPKDLGKLTPHGERTELGRIPLESVIDNAFDQSGRIHNFADSLPQTKDDASLSTQREELESWVQFMLKGEAFGLPVSNVQEILRVENVAGVAHAPFPVRGTANLRGRVLPVIDLRSRLGLPETPINDQSRILVATSRGRQLGLLVDSVQQVLRLSKNRIVPPPADVMTPQSDYIMGLYQLEDSLVVLLSVDLVLQIKDSKLANLGINTDIGTSGV